jgi:hypothetical protein
VLSFDATRILLTPTIAIWSTKLKRFGRGLHNGKDTVQHRFYVRLVDKRDYPPFFGHTGDMPRRFRNDEPPQRGMAPDGQEVIMLRGKSYHHIVFPALVGVGLGRRNLWRLTQCGILRPVDADAG